MITRNRNMNSDVLHCKNCAFPGIYSLVCWTTMSLLLLPGICLFYLSGVSRAEPSVPISGDNGRDTLILVWIYGRKKPHNCKEYLIEGCMFTGDRSMYSQADAVLIQHWKVIHNATISLPPEPRPPGQKWIWLNMESPTNARRLPEYEGIYNLTLSYREDADIFLPLGYLVPNVFLDTFPRARFVYSLQDASDPRPGLVAWVVSHWEDNLERVSVYGVLKEYITIDIFGKAGKPIAPGKDSVVDLIKQYRFYLAFENSQHTDYITEKLWNAVRGGAIPVVLGPSRKNYEHFLPPEAFIHVDDFPTVQDLARYLLKVKDSPDLIQMHLSWRKRYSVYKTTMASEFYCAACRVMKMRKGRSDVVKNLTAWFFT